MRLRHLRAAMAMAMVGSALAVGVVSGPVGAATPYSFDFVLGGNDFAFTGPADTDVTLELRNGATLIDTTLVHTDGAGDGIAGFASALLQSGLKLRATDGVTSRTLTIPNLTASANRVTDVISGVGPASHALRVQVFDCTMAEDCTVRVTRNLTTAANGHYSVDVTSAFDARGNDEVVTQFTSAHADHLTATTFIDAFGLDPATRAVFGCTNEGAAVNLKLLASPGGALVEQHTTGDSCFDQTFNSAFANGRQMTASFASDARINIPATQVTNVGTVVTTHCLPSRPALVEWFSDFTHHLTGNADSTGKFVRDFAVEDPTVVMAGLEIHVQCETAAGDRLEFRRTLPA
jgi:hypothetical protein